MNIEQLRQRLQEYNDQAHQIRTKAEAEKRDLTTEEAANLDKLLDGADRCEADIKRLERLNEQSERLRLPAGRKTEAAEPQQALAPRRGSTYEVERLEALDPVITKNGGFKTLGDMAYHVRQAAIEGGVIDPRLQRLASATTYGQEGVAADGGFALPTDFRTSITQAIMAEDSLLARCDQIPVTGNSFNCPFDETTPWQSSGGVQANWDGEAAAATQSKPQLQDRTIKLNKLRVLVPMTEELLEDGPATDAYLRSKAPAKIAFKVNAAIVSGLGVGQPMGILNSPAKVQVAKESGQQTGTIVAMNILKMWNRCYAPSRARAAWLINQEIEPQLFKLSLPGTDNTGNFVAGWGGFIYMPANNLTGGTFGTLFGRPVIPTQACSALSTEGDIILADLNQYLALLKSGPNPKMDISVHLWFDQDLVAYKFTLRMGGIPWWSAAAAALNGSNTYSPYVTLQSR